MSDDNKVISLEEARLARLHQRNNYSKLIEEYEVLRIKFLYGKTLNVQEARRFIELTKYFVKYGHSESFRLTCQYTYDKYIKKYNL